MADILATASTVIQRNVAGNQRIITAQYAATTAAGSDTVAVPGLQVVDYVNVSYAATAALTTATIVQAYPSTVAGSILVVTSTHNNLSVRYQAFGR